MLVEDLGNMDYETAWRKQEEVHGQVLEGADERILLVEHPPVITLGRRPDVSRNLITDSNLLATLGVQLVQSDRGGDITYHGPGQLVAYPIIRLADHGLSVSGYVHTLEKAIIASLQTFGIDGFTDPKAVGVWVKSEADAKIAAIGVRVRRGATLHGLALNVTTDLRYFNLIVPCGISDRKVTSMHELLNDRCPKMAQVKDSLVNAIYGAI